ncbi:MAG: hypothetical protein GY810_01675 [Aureispira sp.]|nr:hypothetical protein [Aureispira sp.]
MDSLTPKQRQFMKRNRSKIDKLLEALEPPKKEKPVVLPKLKNVKEALAPKKEQCKKTAVDLPRLTAISKLPVEEAEVIVPPVEIKELPRLKSIAVAKVVKANKPKTTRLPRLQKIDKTVKESPVKREPISIDLPRLQRIEKPVVDQDADLGILPKDFDKVDLPRLKRVKNVNSDEKVEAKQVATLPDWVTHKGTFAKKEEVKVVATKPVKKEKTPKAAKKAKPSKEDVLANIAEQKSKLDFSKIGEANATDKDDLKKIKGVGAYTEDKLNALGIYTYAQIVNLTDEDKDLVTEIIGFFVGRMQRDDWKGQAQALMPKPAPKPKKEPKKAKPAKKAKAKSSEKAGGDDDLTKIKGIGPATAKKLKGVGITSYKQLANLKAKDAEIIAESINFSVSRIEKDEWIKQAKKLLKEQKK